MFPSAIQFILITVPSQANTSADVVWQNSAIFKKCFLSLLKLMQKTAVWKGAVLYNLSTLPCVIST